MQKIFIPLAVIFFGILATLPSFFIPLGLPPEGDAIAYHIPLIRWMAEHRTIPNWPWTYVDDYPMLGQILMTPFWMISPALARIVPLFATLFSAYFAAALTADLFLPKNKFYFLCIWACLLGFRPLAIQTNLLMVDNIASCFTLGALFFIFQKKIKTSAAFLALAMATKYAVWQAAPIILFVLFLQLRKQKKPFIKQMLIFIGITSLGVLPFSIRNYLVNQGNPLFPQFSSRFHNIFPFLYGRGHDLKSYFMLPYDILYTNTFVKGFFDYTVGKLFYLQLLLFAFYAAKRFLSPQKIFLREKVSYETFSFFAFLFLYGTAWFVLGAQQMRFLVPAALLLNAFMCAYIFKNAPVYITILLTLTTILSLTSIQKDQFLIAVGKKQVQNFVAAEKAKACIAQVPHEAFIAYRDSFIIGYVDHTNYLYLDVYSLPTELPHHQIYDYIYSSESITPTPGFKPWPSDAPCLLKKI